MEPKLVLLYLAVLPLYLPGDHFLRLHQDLPRSTTLPPRQRCTAPASPTTSDERCQVQTYCVQHDVDSGAVSVLLFAQSHRSDGGFVSALWFLNDVYLWFHYDASTIEFDPEPDCILFPSAWDPCRGDEHNWENLSSEVAVATEKKNEPTQLTTKNETWSEHMRWEDFKLVLNVSEKTYSWFYWQCITCQV